MSKILAVADIHINDYANRNPSNRFRLYQTRTVAQNIIEVVALVFAPLVIVEIFKLLKINTSKDE